MMARHAPMPGAKPEDVNRRTLCGVLVNWRQITREPNCGNCINALAAQRPRALDETPFDVAPENRRPVATTYRSFDPAAEGYRRKPFDPITDFAERRR